MFNRIMVTSLALLAAAIAALTIALLAAIGNLTPQVLAAIEAVAIIEDAANSIEEDMNILRNIADREQCYADRGEWSDEHGCFLQELNQ